MNYSLVSKSREDSEMRKCMIGLDSSLCGRRSYFAPKPLSVLHCEPKIVSNQWSDTQGGLQNCSPAWKPCKNEQCCLHVVALVIAELHQSNQSYQSFLWGLPPQLSQINWSPPSSTPPFMFQMCSYNSLWFRCYLPVKHIKVDIIAVVTVSFGHV